MWLPRGLILARGLAQLSRIHGQIQHIVHDLKGQTGFAAEEVEPHRVVGRGPSVDATGHHAHPDQRARLGAVNGIDQLRRGLEVFACRSST